MESPMRSRVEAIFMAAITISIIVIYLRLTARAMRRLP